jgi:aminoglycoside 3-N-acetyltransferase
LIADPIAARRTLRADLEALGLEPRDAVLTHAALRQVGRILGGPDALIDAIMDAIGPQGTLLGYCDWQGQDDLDDHPELSEDVPPFDPARSRSVRDNGTFPELLRTTPGALRSGSAGASVAALGGRAAWFTAHHPLDYGYGPDSPFGKLVTARGKTLLVGAPRDTMTLLHHAEHLAQFPNKRIRRYRYPMLSEGKKVWVETEEFDTSKAPDGLEEDYFAAIVTEFLATGRGRTGKVGQADCVLVRADEIVPFAVHWIEKRLGT